MELKIHVKDKIEVKDIVPMIKRAIRRVVKWILPKNDKVPKKLRVNKKKARSPPTLGIFIRELIKSKEALGS